jgi:hypothetical protein
MSVYVDSSSKNQLCKDGGSITKNYSLFESDNEENINIDDNDINFNDIDIDSNIDSNIDSIINNNKSLEPVKLIDDFYYFNNNVGGKYIFKIKPTNKVWKLNEHIKQNMNYLYKTSRNFPKIGGGTTNIFYIDTNDISYFLHYYYMYAILDTLKNDNNQLSDYICSVINSLYDFIKINNNAFNLNKKIKIFLNLFSRI